jgi:ABC-type phosphate/phosphonate transport system substrate-binding protein
MTNDLTRREAIGAAAVGLLVVPAAAEEAPIPAGAFVVLVTDPLAADLSCPCVKGYGQRDYAPLGKHLEAAIGRPVSVVYSSSLTKGLRKTDNRADLVIGKDSAVRAEAAAGKLALTHVAALTGLDGKTTHTGLVMVCTTDPALTVTDLKGYRVFFGPAEAEERHAAAVELFKDLGMDVPAKDKMETTPADSSAATKVVDLGKKGEKAAAVIASSQEPLLEGCGTVKRGDLKVVGTTDPVPFVGAFLADKVAADREKVTAALLEFGKNANHCTALETKAGFVKPDEAKKK